MRRAALRLVSSLGEGGLRGLLLVAGVRSFVTSHSSRHFIFRLCLDVLGPVGARTAVVRLLTCLDSPGWSHWCTPCAVPPPRLPSAEHHCCLLHASHHWPRCLLRARLVLAPFARLASPAFRALLITSLCCTRCYVLRSSVCLVRRLPASPPARPVRRELLSVVY